MTDHIDAPKAELLPCPFCGDSYPEICQDRDEYFVSCTNREECGAEGHRALADDYAIECWNRRASYAETVAPYAAAQRMVREAIGELFGPLASIESDEAVLRRGPEPKHEAEAQIAALRRVAHEREAVGVAVKPLEWRLALDGVWRAETIAGEYRVWTLPEANGHWFWGLSGGTILKTGAHPTESAALAAAEADWQQRIRSALVSQPIEPKRDEGVSREMRDAADQARNEWLRADPNDQIGALNAALDAAFQTQPDKGVREDRKLAEELSHDADYHELGRIPPWGYVERLRKAARRLAALNLGREG